MMDENTGVKRKLSVDISLEAELDDYRDEKLSTAINDALKVLANDEDHQFGKYPSGQVFRVKATVEGGREVIVKITEKYSNTITERPPKEMPKRRKNGEEIWLA